MGGMGLRLVQANVKARDDAALGRFWARALGWTSRSVPGATSVAPAGFVWTDPDSPFCIDVIAVPDPRTVGYRAHLELATLSAAHRGALLARLTELGARPAEAGAGEVAGTVLADPQGNLFGVLEPRDSRDTGPIAAVVLACADPRALAGFWGAALGWTRHEVSDDRALLRSATGVGPYLELRRTLRRPEVRHRLHLDVVPERGDDQAAQVARLRALGATPAAAGQRDVAWVVLAAPEGNVFCVLAPG